MTSTEQRLAALPTANHRRIGAAMVKREIADGSLTLGEALRDPRAQSAFVDRLVLAVPRLGETKARGLCVRAGVPALKRVRDLTDRQRVALSAATSDRAAA